MSRTVRRRKSQWRGRMTHRTRLEPTFVLNGADSD